MASNPLSSSVAAQRFRGFLTRARGLILAQPPLVRVLLASTILAGVASIFYLAGQPFSSPSKKYLKSGQTFGRDDLARIRKALDGRVAYSIDHEQRVEVPSEQWGEATGLISKSAIGPRSLDEIRQEALVPSFMDSMSDKQRRELVALEMSLEALIDRLDGIIGCYVKINQSKPTTGLRRAAKISAFVSVESENNAELPYGTVEAIRNIIVKNVNELTPDAVTVMDGKARTYLDADNKILVATSRDRARGEELRQEILQKLDWIKEVRVSVQIVPPPPQSVAPEPTPAPTVAMTAAKLAGPGAGSQGTQPKVPTSPAVALPPPRRAAANVPLDAESVAPEIVEPIVAVEPPAAPSKAPTPAPQSRPEPWPRGKIGVEIPRSFYYRNYMVASSSDKQPSTDEIIRSMPQIELRVKESVRMLVPGPGENWEIRVGMFPDDVPLVKTPAIAHVPESRRQALGWEAIGVVVTLIVVASLSAMVRFGRRPEIRVPTTSGSRRVHRDSPSDPAPSERVRELVRRNPQAAASVLQRWVGQGGDVA